MKAIKPNHSTLNCWIFAVSLCAGPLAIHSAQGEEIEVPIGQQAQHKQSVKRPATGISSNKVRELFGEPIEWKDPVGEPPISSWVYDDFVVYFEFDHVVHTVLKYSVEN